MEHEKLSNLEIADLCRELALLLHSGVRTGDGLYLLAEESGNENKELFLQMADAIDQGCSLSSAFEQSACFPSYVTGLLQVGEQVGRLEETLNALSRYYEEQEQMKQRVYSSLTYPAILLVIMLAVIVVLLCYVLPVFNDIYASLGGQLSGVAGGLLVLGQVLNHMMPFLCALLIIGFLVFLAFSLHSGFNKKVLAFLSKRWGDKGIARKINNSRFVQALSMGYSSGLTMEESIDIASQLLTDTPSACSRCQNCCSLLTEGYQLAEALEKNDLMSPAYCRLLTLGMRSGTADSVLEDIARRMSEETQFELEQIVGKIEPALVLITSVLVGSILLSVMIPLMNIMSAIG